MGKTVNMSFEGTIAGNIYDSEKKMIRRVHLPLGLLYMYLYMTITFKHVHWYLGYAYAGPLGPLFVQCINSR